ncbi:hypothetical protein F4809DRAFT_604713 [Biscogniauxia mediterranea]|nr:hypothetical protein F4809DRAFT_604713 [Biscogniauxia mediterranea]
MSTMPALVVLPEGAPYIALSYVWGKDQALKLKMDNVSLLSSPGCLDSAVFRPSWTICRCDTCY